MNFPVLRRHGMLVAAISTLVIAGCNDPTLSELEVPPGSHVATYRVIDGM